MERSHVVAPVLTAGDAPCRPRARLGSRLGALGFTRVDSPEGAWNRMAAQDRVGYRTIGGGSNLGHL